MFAASGALVLHWGGFSTSNRGLGDWLSTWRGNMGTAVRRKRRGSRGGPTRRFDDSLVSSGLPRACGARAQRLLGADLIINPRNVIRRACRTQRSAAVARSRNICGRGPLIANDGVEAAVSGPDHENAVRLKDYCLVYDRTTREN